jgi:hypothetical protein
MSSDSNSGFEPFEIRNGLRLELGAVRASGLVQGTLALPEGRTHFGLAARGELELSTGGAEYRWAGDGFFVCAGPAEIRAKDALLFVISLAGYRGVPQFGGPLEPRGRLEYIDGCSDTLLVCPPRLGEPCLNHLHIPEHTDQSPHHHASDRLGIIVRGSGRCRTGSGLHDLTPGLAWRIPARAVHSFVTAEAPLDVLAWHPDSDFGPTDAVHPMKNQTFTVPR